MKNKMFKNKQNNQGPCRDVGNYNIGLQPQLLGYGATTIVKCKPQKNAGTAHPGSQHFLELWLFLASITMINGAYNPSCVNG